MISISESFPAFKLIGVPEIVEPGPPGTRVVPSTMIPDDSEVKVSPPAVKTSEASDLAGRSMLEDPMSNFPDGAKEIGVPEMVIAAPPGRGVEPASSKPVDSAVNVWPPTVKVFDGNFGVKRLVLELLMNNTPDGLRDTAVLEIVISVLPGTSLEPASMKPAGLAVIVWPPIVKTNDGVGDSSLASCMGLPSRKSVPEEARLIGVPEMVMPGQSGKSVVPPMTISDGLAINSWPAMLKTFGVKGMTRELMPPM